MPIGKNRFRRHPQHGGKWNPLAIVGICLAAAILCTAIVGNILRIRLDDETYRKYTEGLPEDDEPPRIQTNVPNLHAYVHALGTRVEDAFGFSSVSCPINTPDGRVCYSSDVVRYLGVNATEGIELTPTLEELRAFIPYVSGIFYPQASRQPTHDLRYAAAANEAALLREFVLAGGNEVLLCGIDLATLPITEVTEYLQVLRAALGSTAIGVAVTPALASSEGGWEILGRLLQVCDFLALDLSAESVSDTPADNLGFSVAAAKLLTDSRYFLTQYDMRVLISTSQRPLLEYLEFYAYEDFQLLPAPPTP